MLIEHLRYKAKPRSTDRPGRADISCAIDGVAEADDGGVQALPSSHGLTSKRVGNGELPRDYASERIERCGEAWSYL